MKNLLDKVNAIRIRQKDKPIRIDNLYKIRRRCDSNQLTSGCGTRLAVRLERATGISRLLWLFPREYGNPFDLYFKENK